MATGASQKLRFTVESASGEDPDYPAKELNFHSPHTKGWQSPRFCKFPQELILQLDKPAQVHQIQLLSHEFKISCKIEVFVGLPPPGILDPSQCPLKRLGYLSLDPNERSNHQARELKSVHVDTPAQVIKFLLHKCHPNKLNIYNQVGIVALNIVGQPLDAAKLALAQQALLGRAQNGRGGRGAPPEDPLLESVDAVTAQQLRELLAQKDAAVRNEDYDEAKRLKVIIDRVRAFGNQVAVLEARKQAAVDREDYDAAKKIKEEIDALRSKEGGLVPLEGGGGRTAFESLSLNEASVTRPDPETVFNRVLQSGRNSRPENEDPEPPSESYASDAPPGDQLSDPDSPASPSLQRTLSNSYDDRPIKGAASANGNGYDLMEENGGPDPLDLANRDKARRDSGRTAAASGSTGPRKQWGKPTASPGLDDVGSEPTSPTSPLPQRPDGISAELPEPERQNGEVMKQNAALVTAVGEYTALCILSKSWQLRDAAFQKLLKDLAGGSFPADGAPLFRGLVKATLKGLNDKVASVFFNAIPLVRGLFTSYASEASARDVQNCSGEIIGALLERGLSDSNARVQTASSETLQWLAERKEVGPAAVVGPLLRPVKSQAQWKMVLGRLTLQQAFLQTYGLSPSSKSGLPVDQLMKFVCDSFASANGEVRAQATAVTVHVYRLIGTGVERYLSGLKPVVREALSSEFEKADSQAASGGVVIETKRRSSIGGISEGNLQGAGIVPPGRKKASQPGKSQPGGDPPATKKAKAPPQKRRDLEGGHPEGSPRPPGHLVKKHAHGKHSGKHSGEGGDEGRGHGPRPKTSAHPPPTEEDAEEDGPTDTCQFCGVVDERFLTGETMDLHFFQECPMLCSCDECGQIVEIASLTEHRLEECEEGGVYAECPKCNEAVPQEELTRHSKTCRAGSRSSEIGRCPLCRADIPGEDGWAEHLLEGNGCPRNPRTAR
ncbi:Galactose-binding domain-like [Klebsormidium nitens]|uniref:Galactose-binding domain-like n=1 Tax=Klebsormidium nitens TaxID=105231 RepID=A0A1Y1IAN2_KLENI|nr:Galactose-binding domain-like [Klebsormidium nitens]|eukprot:GAQ85746.1 Galactose-binding domain-like [Klebsormidium nitens]